jgi:hypothetical protein
MKSKVMVLVVMQFPPSLSSYDDTHFESIPQILQHRIWLEPFSLIATIIFNFSFEKYLFSDDFVLNEIKKSKGLK